MLRDLTEKLFKGKSAMWTAFFTFVLTVFTYLQVQISKDAVQVSRDAIRVADNANANNLATERAFLSLAGVRGTKIVKDSKTIVMALTIEWENSGSTPAKGLYGRSNVQAWSSPLPAQFDFKDLADSKGVELIIGPKAKATHTVTVPIDDLMDVTKGRHLYFWGWMRYRDIFPNTPVRLTEYCIELVNVTVDKKDHTDPTAIFNWGAQPCPVPHHCYDEDCKDYAERTK